MKLQIPQTTTITLHPNTTSNDLFTWSQGINKTLRDADWSKGYRHILFGNEHNQIQVTVTKEDAIELSNKLIQLEIIKNSYEVLASFQSKQNKSESLIKLIYEFYKLIRELKGFNY